MTTATIERGAGSVMKNIEGVHDVLTRRKVFGDPYELDGVTLIPVARIGGGGGGGAGDDDSGGGFGSGFGLTAAPVGMYEVHGDDVTWTPALDLNRVIRGGQVLMAILGVCTTLVLLRRRR